MGAQQRQERVLAIHRPLQRREERGEHRFEPRHAGSEQQQTGYGPGKRVAQPGQRPWQAT
jgi:hypothetical protein